MERSVVLVDTSIWVDHLRKGNSGLVSLLDDGAVVCHPFIVGELACGVMTNRVQILSLLQALPKADTASPDEVLLFIDNRGLAGKGLGYVDTHLLASAVLTGVPLWTLGKKLQRAAAGLRAAYAQAAET